MGHIFWRVLHTKIDLCMVSTSVLQLIEHTFGQHEHPSAKNPQSWHFITSFRGQDSTWAKARRALAIISIIVIVKHFLSGLPRELLCVQLCSFI